VNGWLWLWAPVVAQMAAIFFVAGRTSVPSLPAGLSSYTGHFLGYALLGALALRAFAGGAWSGVTPRAAWSAVLLSSAYGVTSELHQIFVPNRRPQVTDWLADTAGAVIAVLVVMAVARARQSRDDQSRSV